VTRTVNRDASKAEAKQDCETCEACRTPGEFSTGAGKSTRPVLRRGADRLVVGRLVEDLRVDGCRRNGLHFFNRTAVDEGPSFRRHLGPVGLAQFTRRLAGRVEVLGVSRHCFRNGVLLRERVAMLVHHLLPDCEVDIVLVFPNPGCVVGVFGFSEHTFVGLGQVDGLVVGLLLGHLLLFVDLDPLGVDRRVVVGEQRSLRLHRGLPEVTLGVLGEVEGLARCRFLSYLSLRVTELLPALERRVLEPGSFRYVGCGGPVGLAVLGVGVRRFVLDDLAGRSELLPAVERRILELGGLRDIGCRGAVSLSVFGERGDVQLVGHRFRCAELRPTRERRLLELASFRRVGRGSAILLEVFRTFRNRSAVDDLLLVNLDPRSTRGVRCPGAILVGSDDRAGVGIASGGVCTGVGRGPVGPRTVVGVATIDGHEACVVRRVDVRSAVGRQVHVPLRVRFTAS